MTSIERFYRLQAPVYDYTRWLTLHGRRRCLERLRLQPTSRILEVGCGTGSNMVRIVPQLFGQGGHFTGVDISSDMLSRAAAKARRNRWNNVSLIIGQAPNVAIGADFDAVVLSYCASMSDAWEALVTWCGSRLRVGGRFAARAPARPEALRRHWHVDAKFDAGLVTRERSGTHGSISVLMRASQRQSW